MQLDANPNVGPSALIPWFPLASVGKRNKNKGRGTSSKSQPGTDHTKYRDGYFKDSSHRAASKASLVSSALKYKVLRKKGNKRKVK